MPDLNANDIEAAKQQVAGTARSMGIKVDGLTSQPRRSTSPRIRTHRGPPEGAPWRSRQEVHRRHQALRPRPLYTPTEALDLVKSLAAAKFDETVELAVRLGSTPARPTRWCGAPSRCPAGTGKDVRVAVFAAGEAANEARAAGADIVGADDLVAQVEGGMLDFDVAIATPDLMAQVGKLGRVLGPRGLMPNPKTGTVTTDVGKAVTEFKGGQVEYRTDRYGNVHVPIGKVSFEPDALSPTSGP